jgi:hypothetical protein
MVDAMDSVSRNFQVGAEQRLAQSDDVADESARSH